MKPWFERLLTLLTFLVSSGCAHSHNKPPLHNHFKNSQVDEPSPCDSNTRKHHSCVMSPLLVHPTQFALGLHDVEKKRAKITAIKDSPKELQDYLQKNKFRAVKGPEETFYIVDGHHRCRALAEESIDKVYLEIIEDESGMTRTDFWQKMARRHLVWPYDENGDGPLDPLSIPGNVLNLSDDPYRAIAEDALDEGAYEKTDVPFQQFMWANFYRKRIDRSLVRSDYAAALKKAKSISHEPAAKDLPGYINNRP